MWESVRFPVVNAPNAPIYIYIYTCSRRIYFPALSHPVNPPNRYDLYTTSIRKGPCIYNIFKKSSPAIIREYMLNKMSLIVLNGSDFVGCKSTLVGWAETERIITAGARRSYKKTSHLFWCVPCWAFTKHSAFFLSYYYYILYICITHPPPLLFDFLNIRGGVTNNGR